eukprot:TRINITY_DN11966_c0_g1_i1.p1 TRINITY_DN11966_c0_g1~~TRINITY_DN11966_c0_g1_i1.p1  ORF type:complete len:929 (+),score=147.93 TRINITY_DN11966_c0_g1_i1:67-2853(+)
MESIEAPLSQSELRLDNLFTDIQFHVCMKLLEVNGGHHGALMVLEGVNQSLLRSIRLFYRSNFTRHFSMTPMLCVSHPKRCTVRTLHWICKYASQLSHIDLSQWFLSDGPETPVIDILAVLRAFSVERKKAAAADHDCEDWSLTLWSPPHSSTTLISSASPIVEDEPPPWLPIALSFPQHIKEIQVAPYLESTRSWQLVMEEAKRLERLWLDYSDYSFSLSYSAFNASQAPLKQLSLRSVQFVNAMVDDGDWNADEEGDDEDAIPHLWNLATALLPNLRNEEIPKVAIHQFPWVQNCSTSLVELDLYRVTGLRRTDFFDCISRCERLEVISLQHVDVDVASFLKLPKQNLVRFREVGLKVPIQTRAAFVFCCPKLKNALVDVGVEVEEMRAICERLWGENLARPAPLLSFDGEDGFVEASLLQSATNLRDVHQRDADALAVVALLLSLSPSCSGALLFKAETLLLAQNYRVALETVDTLLSALTAADSAMARFKAAHLKAIILNRLGMNLEANEFLELAFEFHTEDMWAWTDAATIQLELKQLQKATTSIDRAVALAEKAANKSNTDQIWFRKGLIMQKLKRHDDSIDAFQRAISLNDSASYRFHLGESYRKSSQNAEALVQFERAVELQPNYLVAWNSAGLARSSQRDYINALSCFEKALEISPSDCVVWANKGESLFMQGHYQLAVECFDKSLECAAGADPQTRVGFVWIRKGKALCLIGSYERAVECFEQALQDDPESPVAWEWKGRSLFEQGKMQESLQCYDTALSLAPDDFFAWSGKGLALDGAGQFEEAIKCFNRSLELNKANDLTFRWKGRVLMKNGHTEEAAAVFNTAIEMCNGDNPDHLYRRGMAYHGKGDYLNAVACFSRGLEMDPLDVDAWFDRGESLLQLGRAEEASECYEKALSLCPDYRKATKSLEKLHSIGKS